MLQKSLMAPLSWFLPVTIAFGLALFQIQVANKVTGLGYEIALLKAKEADLLKERGFLQVEFSKLTSRQSLSNMSESMAAHSKTSVDVAGN